MDVSTSHCKRRLVAAFDFGTTFSGYAFSFRETPLEIKFNPSWAAGSQKLISLKTPTCVLLKPDKEFHSFGFEAENKYSQLVVDDEHHGWYLFKRFKMILYDTKDLHLDTLIEDISGKKMPALTIFGHSIRYLNNHLLKTLCTQTGGVQAEDIQYVLTVPAIWDQKAKQFMRNAANEGGINDDQLRIALEPEAASIWCQVATENKLRGLTEAGSKYVVVDLGGGTADITVHEKMTDGTLKEIHKASGGLCGGIKVDNAYEEMLLSIFGVDAMTQFKTKHIGDYLDLLRDFETKKRTVKTDTDGKMTFIIPAALQNCVSRKNIQTVIKKSKYRGKITFSDDKMRIEKVVARSFFDKVLADLTNHVEEILSDTCPIDTILLVGGFGECELVKETFKKKFPNKEVKIPEEPGLAVLRGSVRFGHLPEIVSVRASRFTYGWRIFPCFDKLIHDEAKKVNYNGEERCSDVFSTIVQLGEEIPSGTEILKKGIPASKDQKYSPIQIYSSKYKDPKYVTDEGCTLLATINMDIPESDDIEDKKHYVYLTFGSTELKVRVVMKTTNKAIETIINCFLIVSKVGMATSSKIGTRVLG